jgi:N-acetylglucosaminyl-diphospho-decaprenol L-rhamnosyltransferase
VELVTFGRGLCMEAISPARPARRLSLSVVIVSFNSGHCLPKCFLDLRAKLPAAEIVVVDNASSDGSLEIASRLGADVVVALPRNEGFGWAANAGVAAATGVIVMVMNPDVSLQEVDVAALSRECDVDQFGLLVPAQIEPRRSGNEATHPVFIDRVWPIELARVLWAPFRSKPILPTRARSDKPGWVAGAIFLVARAEFGVIGGFSESFFLYWEDRELSWRYRLRELPIRRSRSITAVHDGGQSTLAKARPNVAGWNLLGMVEYIAVSRGPRVGRASAEIVANVIWAQALALRAASRVNRSPRAARKSTELGETRGALRRAVASEDGTPARAWPHARRAFAACKHL